MDMIDSGNDSPTEEDRTTILLENIPNKCCREVMRETLDQEGFAGAYNFVFVPMDMRTRSANGNAFLNFLNGWWATRALNHFNGFTKWPVPSESPVTATFHRWSQGMEIGGALQKLPCHARSRAGHI